MERRSDYKTALLIDAALRQASAARAMAALGVPFAVARRVLMRPGARRHPLPAPDFRRES